MTECLHRPREVKAHVRACMLNYFHCVRLCVTLQTYPARLLCPWDSPGKNIGVSAISSSRGFSRLRNWTCVSYISCIGRWVLYHWATRKAKHYFRLPYTMPELWDTKGPWLCAGTKKCYVLTMVAEQIYKGVKTEYSSVFYFLVLSMKLLCLCENKFCLPQRLHNSLMAN